VITADRKTWWSARRNRYNITLIIAAPLSLLATLIVWGLFEERLPCLEITGLGILAGFWLFLIGLLLANICYLLGPLSERVVRPRNVALFRSWVYRAGTAFSVLLLFAPAMVNLIAALLGPLPCTDKLGVRHGVGSTSLVTRTAGVAGRANACGPAGASEHHSKKRPVPRPSTNDGRPNWNDFHSDNDAWAL
jgi:hypothetical protein